MQVIKIREQHYPRIAEIYLQGIATGNATFQTDAPTWEDWDKSHLPHSRIALGAEKQRGGSLKEWLTG
ncbi:MAG: hypothetical protein EOO06_16740 [Chitinophagaceae bacterium]|nr:MAG: hypothetical protein EOO06_16740 [Chitinophagaceae bacterium]